jgi:RHS repeat-associated protein
MTQLVSSAPDNTGFNYKYNYSATQNNGRVQSITDVASGETITYQYDALNRMIQASGTGDSHGAWSQQFTFDGFGNLTQKIGNNAPNNLTINVDPTTNRLTGNGALFDANGNLTQYNNTLNNPTTYSYDIENRLTGASGTSVTYGYDASNQRVYSKNGTTETYYFYGIDGKKLGVWTIPASSTTFTLVSLNTWFGGRLLKPQDRLNSIGKYFPYGEDRTSPSPANPTNGQEKFATYTRDAETGLDYAYQRYYTAGLGRFMTPDPYGRSGHPYAPQSWNRYEYVHGDPVGHTDSLGLFLSVAPGGLDSSFEFGDGVDSAGGGGGAGKFGLNFAMVWLGMEDARGDGPTDSGPWQRNIKTALGKITAQGLLGKGPCAKFLQALVSENGLSMTAGQLANEIQSTAQAIESSPACNNSLCVFDGTSSNTPLDSAAFPGTGSATAQTVGQFSMQGNGATGLSQFNGLAIFVDPSQWSWAGVMNNLFSSTARGLGIGTLVHEILHKQMVAGGFSHGEMDSALTAAGYPLGSDQGSSADSAGIAALCFP